MKRFVKALAAFVVALVLAVANFGVTGGVTVHADNSAPGSAAAVTLNGDWTYGSFTTDDSGTAWYSVALPSDGNLTITGRSDFYTVVFTVYNADQTKTYGDFGVSGSDANDPGSDNKTFGLDAGTYLIKAQRWYSNPGNYSFKLSFQAAGNDDGHDNRSFANATAVNFNQTVNGFLSGDNSDDFYKITVPQKENVIVTLTTPIWGADVTVYNGDQTDKVIETTAYGHGDTDPATETPEEELDAGTYFVKVSSSNTGKYTLKVTTDTPTPAATEAPQEQKEAVVTMYRAYNPNSGEHFYTSNTKEFNYLVSIGWRNEGTGWVAPQSSSTPVYRLYNKIGGEHHYTLSEKEKNALVAVGWKDEGIGWYSDDAKRVPLYRQYNPNAFANNHNYTTVEKEKNYLVSIGWRDEGIGWYGVSAK